MSCFLSQNYLKNKKGFTLAEVLITLGVIGVVAALTLPNLISSYRNKTYVVSLQKFYSEFLQVIKKSYAENSCSDIECLGLQINVPDDQWYSNAENWISTNFSILKIRKVSTLKNRVYFYYLNNTNNNQLCDISCFTYTSSKDIVFVTQSGYKVEISASNSDYLYLIVDINGDKSPNTAGRDVFFFIITKEGHLYPLYGNDYAGLNSSIYWNNNSSFCGTDSVSISSKNVSGLGCAARIIESGWKMKY